MTPEKAKILAHAVVFTLAIADELKHAKAEIFTDEDGEFVGGKVQLSEEHNAYLINMLRDALTIADDFELAHEDKEKH